MGRLGVHLLDETSVTTWSPCKNEDVFIVKSYLTSSTQEGDGESPSVQNIEQHREHSRHHATDWDDVRAGMISTWRYQVSARDDRALAEASNTKHMNGRDS